MSEAALTLSELVARIAAPGEDLAVLTDKLKGWIKEGLYSRTAREIPEPGTAAPSPKLR